jgi:hypothetical protein
VFDSNLLYVPGNLVSLFMVELRIVELGEGIIKRIDTYQGIMNY